MMIILMINIAVLVGIVVLCLCEEKRYRTFRRRVEEKKAQLTAIAERIEPSLLQATESLHTIQVHAPEEEQSHIQSIQTSLAHATSTINEFMKASKIDKALTVLPRDIKTKKATNFIYSRVTC